jgi:hypothetical protein
MSREKNLTSDNNIKMKVSFTVETYYPAFRSDRVNGTGYPQAYGSGMSDLNGFALNGGVSDYFQQPGVNRPPGDDSQGPRSTPNVGNVPPYGATTSFYNTQTASPSDGYGTFTNSDYLIVSPKRTRWFNNILKAREKASGNIINPNGSQGPADASNP